MTMSIRQNRMISILLVIILVLLLIFNSYIQAEAIAPLVVYSGLAVASALLVACGYYGLSASDVSRAWDSMGQSLRSGLSSAAQNFRQSASNFAIARGIISSVVYNEFASWFNLNAKDGSLANAGSGLMDFTSLKANWVYPAPIDFETVDVGGIAMLKATGSSYAYRIVIYNPVLGGKVDWHSSNKVILFESSTPFYLTRLNSSSQGLRIQTDGNFVKTTFNADGGEVHSSAASGSGYTGESLYLNDITNTGYYYSNSPLKFEENGALLGLLFYTAVTSDAQYRPSYSPVANPLTADSDGNFPISMPYTDAPDTNVAIPEDNSIDNPVSLQTVIDGYGSIDGFFESGGVITLTDGTVISGSTGVNDLTRSGGQVLPNTGTGTIEGDVSGIKSLLNRLVGTATAIGTAITDWGKISDFSLDFDPLKVNFATKFPFCIPFDFINLITAFSASPTDFQFRINLDTAYFTVDHTVDLSPFRVPILFFRYIVVIWFSFILMSRTRDFMKW